METTYACISTQILFSMMMSEGIFNELSSTTAEAGGIDSGLIQGLCSLMPCPYCHSHI